MKRILSWVISKRAIDENGFATSSGLLLLRLSVGLIMAFSHGLNKLLNFSARSANFPDPIGLGNLLSMSLVVFAEFFCSIALMVGFITRGAVMPLIITMFVAASVIHGDDPFNKKELALLFLTAYSVILITGPGKYSLDRLMGRKLR
jgi:putative oxidoreductase